MAASQTKSSEAQKLSQNWQRLQQQLKLDVSKSAKRKSDNDPRHSNQKRQATTRSKKAASGSDIKRWKEEMNIQPLSHKAETHPASLAQWAEDNDISAEDLMQAYSIHSKDEPITQTTTRFDRINGGLLLDVDAGKYIAIDCEMVGVGPTPEKDSALARVSIVNYHGQQLYDSYVMPKETITDYRTRVSGVTPKLLENTRSLQDIQTAVKTLLEGRTLVGHAVRNDLEALRLIYPRRDIRDTSKYSVFRKFSSGATPSLKRLAKEVLGIDIQEGEHSSLEDARAAMALFKSNKNGIESEHRARWGPWPNSSTSAGDSQIRPKKQKKKGRKR